MANTINFLFLLASERSGSNLITRMWANHPRVAGPPPTHLIRTFTNNLFRYGDLSLSKNWRALCQDVSMFLESQLGIWQTSITLDELLAVEPRNLANIVALIYGKEANHHGKNSVLIKENQAYKFLPFYQEWFPEAKYLVLVRDPRDMALSWKLSANHPGGVMNAAENWRQDQEEAIKIYGYLGGRDKITLVRYEDLLQEPEAELKRLCAFFKIEFSPSMLDFHQNRETILNAGRLENWANLKKPILNSNFNKYREKLSETEIRYIEAVCHGAMTFLGYSLDFPLEKDNLGGQKKDLAETERGSLGFSGSELTPEEQEIRKRRYASIQVIINRTLWKDEKWKA